jgi:hypothetical protein
MAEQDSHATFFAVICCPTGLRGCFHGLPGGARGQKKRLKMRFKKGILTFENY